MEWCWLIRHFSLWSFVWVQPGWFWGNQSKVTLDTCTNTILIFSHVNMHKGFLYHFVFWCYISFVSGRLAGLLKVAVIYCCELTGRGLSSSSSPIPNGSPRPQWNKRTNEEAVVGLVYFCWRLGPCGPSISLRMVVARGNICFCIHLKA